MNIVSMHRAGSFRSRCPDIEELVRFTLGAWKSSFIDDHLMQCEICEDLAGGIDAFGKEKEGITPKEFHSQLIDKDEASLKTLKLPENRIDLIGEIIEKLDLPDIIEISIRRTLKLL